MNKYDDIEWICGHEPMREGEYATFHKVGVNGVTKIVFMERIYGDHGIGEFVVYTGDENPAYVMTHRAVAEIGFKQVRAA